jgi:hypothetical protein
MLLTYRITYIRDVVLLLLFHILRNVYYRERASTSGIILFYPWWTGYIPSLRSNGTLLFKTNPVPWINSDTTIATACTTYIKCVLLFHTCSACAARTYIYCPATFPVSKCYNIHYKTWHPRYARVQTKSIWVQPWQRYISPYRPFY